MTYVVFCCGSCWTYKKICVKNDLDRQGVFDDDLIVTVKYASVCHIMKDCYSRNIAYVFTNMISG